MACRSPVPPAILSPVLLTFPLWCLAFAAPLYGAQPATTIPAGADIQIRLTVDVGSETSHPKQAVQAVVIAPVLENGRVAVPQGAQVSGLVTTAQPVSDAEPNRPASLLLQFDRLQIAGTGLRLDARVYDVDNARETVDGTGKIIGINPHDAIAARIEQAIGKLKNSERYGALAGIIEGVKGVVLKDADPNIAFDAGAELTLRLTKALPIPASVPVPQPALESFPDEGNLSALVNAQPFQTYAKSPHRPSDITNLMFIGSERDLEAAFAEAGWTGAQRLSRTSKFETAVAIMDDRGYQEAPVSVLMLGNRPPDRVFQKGNDTFAARHHLRLWRSPDTLQGRTVWVCSSTHDTGIDFSQREMTFIHKIDSNIDLERAKVVDDLLFTGKVRALALVARPAVPKHAVNATGDDLITDGNMAVLLLR